MPTRPKKQKIYPQSDNGYSSPTYRSRPEYHTARWARMSRRFREQPQHIWCARCLKRGIHKLAEVTDHIIPAEICGDFWDESNWQPLCRKCNDAKAAEDRELIARHRQGVGGRNLSRQNP